MPSDQARTHQSDTSLQETPLNHMGTHVMVSLSPSSCSGTHCDSVEPLPNYQHMVISCIALDVQGHAVSMS